MFMRLRGILSTTKNDFFQILNRCMKESFMNSSLNRTDTEIRYPSANVSAQDTDNRSYFDALFPMSHLKVISAPQLLH